jgi:hypothetical protein
MFKNIMLQTYKYAYKLEERNDKTEVRKLLLGAFQLVGTR